MDTIKLDTGYISGTKVGEPGQEAHFYRGVPYAAPPVGDLRWKPPPAPMRKAPASNWARSPSPCAPR